MGHLPVGLQDAATCALRRAIAVPVVVVVAAAVVVLVVVVVVTRHSYCGQQHRLGNAEVAP